MKNNQKKKDINKRQYHNKYNEDSNFNSLENNEMLDNLIKISGNQEVYKELKDETSKIKQLLSQSKEKLDNINLLENQNSDIDIYQWNNLFNQSIPITSYVSSSKSIKIKNNKKEENKNNVIKKDSSKMLKHPVTLVDLNDEEIKKYLPPSPNGVPPTSVIRFQQLPFKGDSKDTFYFSNAFNDYYKMDFKDFIKIMPILKAKKRCKSAKLSYQIKKSKNRSIEEDHKREILKNEMLNKLNNLYIEKQYLSLSKNANNIQPLMSSIHAQIYPGKGDELTKHTKIYIKSDKPLGSERDVDNIDFTINQRDYHRNELNRIKYNRRRVESATKRLILPRYDVNDPDIAIFKKAKERIIIDETFNDNLLLDKSLINCEGESKKEEEEKEVIYANNNRKTIKSEDSLNNEESQNQNNQNIKNNNNNNNNYEKLKLNLKNQKLRALSANKGYSKKDDIMNSNNYNLKKNPRAMSAHIARPIDNQNQNQNQNQNEYCIHNIYLSTRNKLGQNIFAKNYSNHPQRNKSDLLDDYKRGYSSSQISTYEGMNNSLYDNQNYQRHGFPFKIKHQLQNKMYLKINRRIKEKQYEKDQQKLEEFSKLIRLDDAFLSDDFSKEKMENNSNTANVNGNNQLLYIDKNKIFKRPLSSNLNSFEMKMKKVKKKNKNAINKPQTPILYKHKNTFRAVSKKSSNENSKIEFTTSVLNTKQEFFFNNNNDKVTFVYFNDVIETKPQKINEMKPIIRNDGIIVASNYFNRGKPQLLNYRGKLRVKGKKNFRRSQSGKIIGKMPNIKDNINIQDENLQMNKKKQ
jgi:hypothetical protein